MFYREGAGFAVEEVRPYGPNVISFEVVTGRRRWYIIGCYLAPDDARTIEQVVTAMGDQPRGTALIVAGDLTISLLIYIVIYFSNYWFGSRGVIYKNK